MHKKKILFFYFLYWYFSHFFPRCWSLCILRETEMKMVQKHHLIWICRTFTKGWMFQSQCFQMFFMSASREPKRTKNIENERENLLCELWFSMDVENLRNFVALSSLSASVLRGCSKFSFIQNLIRFIHEYLIEAAFKSFISSLLLFLPFFSLSFLSVFHILSFMSFGKCRYRQCE